MMKCLASLIVQVFRRHYLHIEPTIFCKLSSRTVCEQDGKRTVIPPNSGSEMITKSYDEIPTKNGLLPSLLELILSGGPDYLHEHCDRRHKELGPIYREYLGPIDLVFLADTKLIRTVIANEGQYPHHNVPEAWSFYNRINNVERGLFFQVGKPWAKLRKVFNRVMLADAAQISRFTPGILEINSNLLNCWESAIEHSSSGPGQQFILIEDVKAELCKWSIETMGFMLFGSRMGCIPMRPGLPGDSKATELVYNVANMFFETSKFQILPVHLAYKLNLSSWKKFEAASTSMIRIANDYATDYIAKAKSSKTGDSIVKDILEMGELSDVEVTRSIVDLIIAAADTTSNSLQWMLYLIAKHQDVQLKILNEVNPLLEGCGFEDLMDRAPYLRSFLKEASRLYPTAPFLARSLDKEIKLNGYSIPAKQPIVFSLYTTSRMENYFEQPLEFRPERWLRSNLNRTGDASCPRKPNHAYASLPFGIGARMCIGRRAAELEMYLFIASYVKKFESSLSDCDDVRIKLKMILRPAKPIKIKLRPRQAS